eukprot:1357887-Rhodomonas_salina.2
MSDTTRRVGRHQARIYGTNSRDFRSPSSSVRSSSPLSSAKLGAPTKRVSVAQREARVASEDVEPVHIVLDRHLLLRTSFLKRQTSLRHPPSLSLCLLPSVARRHHLPSCLPSSLLN